MKIENYLFVILVLSALLFFIVNWSPYPKNPEKWFEIRYYVGGNLECLIPSSITGSAVDIYLTINEIDIRDIRVTKLCDFNEGYIDFEITGLKGEPYVYGLNRTFYSVNKTESDKFRINLNSDLMEEGYVNGDYAFSVKSKISDKFYTIYEISSNTKPWAVIFYYPISFKGYSCDECFSLLEGNLRRVHPDEKIYESGNVGHRRFFFEDENRVVISFNPKIKLKETFKEFLSGLFISIIAGIITFFLIEYNKKNNKINESASLLFRKKESKKSATH